MSALRINLKQLHACIKFAAIFHLCLSHYMLKPELAPFCTSCSIWGWCRIMQSLWYAIHTSEPDARREHEPQLFSARKVGPKSESDNLCAALCKKTKKKLAVLQLLPRCRDLQSEARKVPGEFCFNYLSPSLAANTFILLGLIWFICIVLT